MDTPTTVRVKDEKELIEKIKNGTSFFSSQTIKEYMAGFAERAAMFGYSIDTSSHKTFVNDLIKIGYVQVGAISLSKK